MSDMPKLIAEQRQRLAELTTDAAKAGKGQAQASYRRDLAARVLEILQWCDEHGDDIKAFMKAKGQK